MISTPVLVLRKTPYSETSVIAATLSPEYGRLDFLIRGAKQISKKKFPQVDLFREIEVQFNHRNTGLNTIHTAELLHSFDSISNYPMNYLRACEVGIFILRNSHGMNPSPEVYSAMKTALSAMGKEKTDVPWGELIKLVYLDEHGFLPEDMERGIADTEMNQNRKNALVNLVNAVINGSTLPDYPQKTWLKFSDWIDKLCRYHELE